MSRSEEGLDDLNGPGDCVTYTVMRDMSAIPRPKRQPAFIDSIYQIQGQVCAFFSVSPSLRLERSDSPLVLPKCRLQKDAFFLLTPEASVCRTPPQSGHFMRFIDCARRYLVHPCLVD